MASQLAVLSNYNILCAIQFTLCREDTELQDNVAILDNIISSTGYLQLYSRYLVSHLHHYSVQVAAIGVLEFNIRTNIKG